VSVELVFRLDLVRATLARIDALLELAVGHGGGGFALAVELVRGSASQHSLRGLLRATMRGLALKVVEHTAQTGEHSIATTRAEWWAMLRSASRGGALTSVTAFLKYALATLPLAPGLMGGAMALNYSISFIVLQFLGFSLASKQPSMTGSALADALDQKNGLGAEIDLVASIARTQLIAAIGNVCVAIPAALLLDLAWRAISGHPLLNATQAEHGLVDLHPGPPRDAVLGSHGARCECAVLGRCASAGAADLGGRGHRADRRPELRRVVCARAARGAASPWAGGG
jgi:site-specific recombinase